MTYYQIIYLDSEGDDYSIDGNEEPFLLLGVAKGLSNTNHQPFKITWVRDGFYRKPIIEAPPEWWFSEIAAVLKHLDDLLDAEQKEFYSDLFYDDETEEHSKALIFSL